MNKRFFLFTLLMMAVLIMSACGPAGTATTSPTEPVASEVPTSPTEPVASEVPTGLPVRGGTLRAEYNWIPYIVDPAADGVGTGFVGLAIAETLVWIAGDGTPRPLLVKTWDVNENVTEWTLHLQEGVKFNNGKSFGADDVIWNILHWLDPATGSSLAANLSMLKPEGVEKVDDLTVKLTLDAPNADLLYALYDYPAMIAPEGGWTDFYSGDPADAVGTGPFMMESFTPDERMVLVRNPNYWQIGADGQPLPYVDKLIVTSGWDDAARLAALVGDEADIVTPGDGVLAEMEKYPSEINLQTYARFVAPIVMRVDMPPFDDVRVRQALKMVQDRQQIKDLLSPRGYVGYDHWIDSSDASYCPDTDASGLQQDIEGAKALLVEAGYADGLELELTTPDDYRAPYAEVFKEQAALAGITVNINNIPSSAFWDQWMNWPFSVTGWNPRVPATANISLALRCGGGWNESYYCNPEFDDLLDQVAKTVDIEKRRELSCQIQTIMQEDGPYLIPFWMPMFGATQSNVHLPDEWSQAGFRYHMVWLSPE